MSGTQGLQENLPKFVFPNIQGRLRLDGPKTGGVRVFDGLSRGKEKGKERWVNSHNSGQTLECPSTHNVRSTADLCVRKH